MKIQYWPNQPSVNLNSAVVQLFIETEKKLLFKKHNRSKKYLYLDILNNFTKIKLLQNILYELKELLLDIIEINLTVKEIVTIKTKIIKIFTIRVSEKFFIKFNQYNFNDLTNTESIQNDLTDYLLIYLIFGASYIPKNIFLFETIYTPYSHVKILLENFIINISNKVIQQFLYSMNASHNINNHALIYNKIYSSKRSISLFINNLKIQNNIEKYIEDVKSAYNERQKIWVINSKNIELKYIYLSNKNITQQLNKIQIVFILWLEIKDVIIPKIEKFIIQVAKYTLYCLINLFSNLILIIIRTIILYINK